MGPLTRTLKIGIIGFGPFAQFLAKTMIKQGHLLTATSRSDHSGHQGVNFFRQLLLQEVPEDSDLVCTHPMFGPESGRDGWRDLTFMYERVRVRDDDLCSSFLTIFECEGCKMLEMSCEEHDRLAAESQFLTHTIGRILSEMEIMNTPIDTKGFEKLVQVKETTMRDSFDLYSGLFIHNRFAKQQLKNLESAVQRVKGILEARMNKGDEQKCDQ
ncbi:arogenate dehydrogenase 1, chloroplastic-like isoform X2 [Cynara cardunculus var. scolymus]|uniref:arogenate dehydrogenase 1, chloroplastic-like isoform X2 n=1 Tax=Cynara cardunculus var. scolymus TaxID=59895 RepID=UPI000D6255C9|nr:arogenate dehydrogenase 1, chloroplastic-like isoform X2 [Cynara cardunculus var. scolymus]